MTTQTLTTYTETLQGAVIPVSDLQRAGAIANRYASASAFSDYRSRKAKNTVDRQDNDLANFAKFLASAGIAAGELAHDPESWRGMTFGIVEAFSNWQLAQGYSIGTINLRLTTVKTYARLAFKAGALDVTEHALIRTVNGYAHREGKRIDAGRDVVRVGNKKAEAVSVTTEQAAKLKTQPNTAQGRRDALIMCLLIDLGLRVGELVGLTVEAVDIKAGVLTFYREKVDTTQSHKMPRDLLNIMRAYMANDAKGKGALLRASNKGGKLGRGGLTRFGIAKRVQELGVALGIDHLSPHDLRHYWATSAARNGTQIDRLQDAGGWASAAMPMRYIERAAIANEGVRFGE